MESVTIVQLTDTHFFGTPDGKLMGVDTAGSFRQVKDLVQRHQAAPDFYLLTGDLSQDETENSYARFAEAIRDFKAPAYFLAGNQDARDSMHKAFENSGAPVRFEKHFVAGKWQVILLDTQIPGEVGGRLSAAELKRLDKLLSDHADKHALVTMHHHPVPVGSSWLDGIRVDNGAEFMAVLSKHQNVRGVLWGHIHQEFEGNRNGLRLLGTPSTCVQFKPKSADFALDSIPAGYRRLTLTPDGTIETAVLRVDKVADGLDFASKGY